MGQFKRKKPFSNKQKKVQLKQHRQKRAIAVEEQWREASGEPSCSSASGVSCALEAASAADRYGALTADVISVNRQPQTRGGRSGGRNRYNLQFCRAKLDAEFALSKTEMYEPVQPVGASALEVSSEDFFPVGLTFPERPEGYQTMTKEKLDMLENKSVRLYAEQMESLFSGADINLYEQNPETWKQLWRVFDKSDVLLFIVDMRFAVCQFPPYVYRRLQQQRRGVVLVLNKVDLVPALLVLAWQDYFTNLCPGIQVVPFCSHESIQDRRRKMKLALHSCQGLVDAIEKVAPREVNLSSWKRQLEEEAEARATGAEYEVQDDDGDEHEGSEEDESSGDEDSEEDEDGEEDEDEGDAEDDGEVELYGASTGACALKRSRAFTIGTIGYPNVGKSSLINAIMGKYKVSVSQTPGHTKHFQTHYLTAARDVMLCDCPGLVFPAVCPYKLQVLSGTFPISQVRAPMAVVGFLAARINMPRALSLKMPEDYIDEDNLDAEVKWTPFSISEAYALKRGYRVRQRGGRADVSRAANELLRMSLAARGQLVLALRPRGFEAIKESHERDEPRLRVVQRVQGVHAAAADVTGRVLSFESMRGSRRQGEGGGQRDVSKHKESKEKISADKPAVANKFAVLQSMCDDEFGVSDDNVSDE